MAYTTIDKPSDYFNTVLYTGNGYPTSGTQSITGVGFQPDWLWVKCRDAAQNNNLSDVIRGASFRLKSNATSAESELTDSIASHDSDGFSLGTGSDVNLNNNKFVAWNWKAGGSGSTNTDGSVNSTVSANATAGFSIVEYNTAGSGTQTVGHGLGSAPTFIITKPAKNTESWYVYIPTGVGSSLRLNTTAAAISSTPYAGTPTDTLFSINNGIIGGYSDVISYCFTDVKGYSKFGSYTGNGNADGTFVYTGFKPAWVMVKQTNSTGNWVIWDSTRQPENLLHKRLYANLSDAEYAGDSIGVDFLSNGFKHRSTVAEWNGSGNTMIYMAFAENPFTTSTGVPGLAR